MRLQLQSEYCIQFNSTCIKSWWHQMKWQVISTNKVTNKKQGIDTKETCIDSQYSQRPDWNYAHTMLLFPSKLFARYSVMMDNLLRPIKIRSRSLISLCQTILDAIKKYPKTTIVEWQDSHLVPKRTFPWPITWR